MSVGSRRKKRGKVEIRGSKKSSRKVNNINIPVIKGEDTAKSTKVTNVKKKNNNKKKQKKKKKYRVRSVCVCVCVCVYNKHGELNRLEGNNVMETHETLLPFCDQERELIGGLKRFVFLNINS